jgi:hypothetical protein
MQGKSKFLYAFDGDIMKRLLQLTKLVDDELNWVEIVDSLLSSLVAPCDSFIPCFFVW